ncbi:MAG: hypothetical protein KJ957_00600 [Candidatus Omnitrophica bacterium]|nr:hypothetical protein [Candidatus Omnitrophota bacterium]MBU1852527.1 hypothetical protein [Candidatus Omnitrophota bacterium]
MKSILLVTLMFCFIVQLFCGVVWAENEGEIEYSWGIVKEVSSGTIVVTEEGYSTDEDVDMVYSIDKDVKLVDAKTLDDIKIGDEVEIEYVLKGDKPIAKVIYVIAEEEEYEEDL